MTSGAPAVTGEEEVAPAEQSEEESQRIAVAFILSSPTFTRDGREDTLRLLATTALEQPFSWQFEYEFQCGHPGYGRLTGEPTPIIITPHRAEIVVQEGKVISAVLDNKWDMLQQRMIGEDSTPVAPLKGNHIFVGFVDSINYHAWEDSFTNHEVFGQRLWRLSHTENIKDETGEPVRGLKITLDSDLVFDWVASYGALTTKRGPPTYEWFYGDLTEDYTGHPKDACVGFTFNSEYATEFSKFTPGFDVSRSFDKTMFTAPDTQTVTVTFTKREESFDRVMICVTTIQANTDLVNAVIISHSEEWYEELGSGEDHAEFGGMSTGGIPVELNTPVTVTVTIQVTPKVPVVQYKPVVHVAPYYPTRSDSGTVQGSSFSFTDEAGTWTVSAEGEYIWNWDATLDPRGVVELRAERGNTPPALTPAGVSPPSGTPKTDFTFEVTYRDNGPPSYVRVYIDGFAQDMSCVGFKGQGYTDGAIFSHTTALSGGRHSYYFEASDAGLMTARFPETGTLSIEVTGWGLGFITWIVAGVVIIGLVTYFFIIRRRRRRVV